MNKTACLNIFFSAVLFVSAFSTPSFAEQPKQAIPNSAVSRPVTVPNSTIQKNQQSTQGVAPTGVVPRTYVRPQTAQQPPARSVSAAISAGSTGGRFKSSNFYDVMNKMYGILTTAPTVRAFDHTKGKTNYANLEPPKGEKPKLIDPN